MAYKDYVIRVRYKRRVDDDEASAQVAAILGALPRLDYNSPGYQWSRKVTVKRRWWT